MAKKETADKLPKGISKRQNGLYMGRVMYHGKSHTLYNRSLSQLKKDMTTLRYELEHGMYAEKSKLTFDDWFKTWIETYKAPSVKQGTIDTYKNNYNSYIKSELGKVKLDDLRSEHIQIFFNGLAKRGLSDKTISLIFTLMGGMLKQACKNGLIIKNPIDAVTKPKGKAGKGREALTVEQQKLFLEAAKESYLYNLLVVAICTGLRRGELGGLQWRDIDFKNKVIHVRHNLVFRMGGGWEIDTPKTKCSLRDVPIIDKAYEALKAQEKLYRELMGNITQIENDDFVFFAGINEPVSGHRMKKELDKITEAIAAAGNDFPTITMHWLRHTFATRCVEGGMKLQVLKTIMGHSSLAMTADLYSHVLPDTKQEAMQSVAGAF